MKVTIDIPNEYIYNCLDAATRYYSPWCHDTTIVPDGTSYASEADYGEDGDRIIVKKHRLNIKLGLERLAKFSPWRFSNLMRGETDAIDADVFLQLCAGLMHEDGPKYG